MAKSKKPRYLGTRVAMMPRDTNGAGHIFGGVLLSEIDIAGAIVAREACPKGSFNRIVTRAMDKVEFKRPVLVGDVITCWGSISRMGRTSIDVHIDVEANRAGDLIHVTAADVTYVAVDENGKPVPIACGTSRRRRRSPVPAEDTKPPLDPSKRVLAIRKTMMPNETNGMYNIFGGVLLSHMDLAASYVARRACANSFIDRMVTRLMDKVEFKQPVHVNDVISCYGTVTHLGTTSVTVHVEVEADRGGEVLAVTSADLVFVAVDEDGRPAPVVCSANNTCPTARNFSPRNTSKGSRGR